jgi:hypothetical protein
MASRHACYHSVTLRDPYLTQILFADFPEVQEKNGSSGRTRTYNPPVNSCTNAQAGNYRQLRLILKIRRLRHFQQRLSTANFGGDSLKKSPKYSLLNSGAIQGAYHQKKTRHAGALTPDTALTDVAYEGGNNG